MPALMLFRLISWPYARKHALRSLLTVTGIVIGVSVFVAMHAANQSVFNAFQETVNHIAGATDLQVSAGEPGFDEEYLQSVQAVEGVKVAAPVVEEVVSTRLTGQGNLLILGIDMMGDRELREYDMENADDAIIDDPLVFLAQPDSLMVTTDFARRNNLRVGAAIPLETVDGVKQFTVRGVLRSHGLNSAYGGNLAIMDIYAAQHIFGRGRKFDRIDVGLDKGREPAGMQRALQAALGPGFQVQPPGARGRSFRSILRVYRSMMNFSSMFALVIGMFIIYSAFSIAVNQRRFEIGMLRALGATRGQIRFLFLGESFVAAAAGSLLGLVAGHYAAGAVASVLSDILEGAYGIAHTSPQIENSLSVTMVAVGLGILTGSVAAFIPARNAAKLDPVLALQRGPVQGLSGGQDRVRAAAAALLVLVAAALLLTRSLALFYCGYVCMLAGVLLLTSRFSLFLTRVLRPVLSWLRPVEGTLAADSLIRAAGRTSATVAALMLSLALVVGLAGMARSSRSNIMGWVSSALNADLFVSSSQTLASGSYKFPASMSRELEAISGVAAVETARTARIEYRGEMILLKAVELEKVAQRSPRQAVEGDAVDMFRRGAQGRGVIASENFASMRRLHVGDRIDLPSPAGLLQLPVLGVIRDYSDQEGSLLIDRALFKKNWNDDSVDFFRAYLAPGASVATVKEAILARFAADRRLFVLSNQEVRRYITRLTDQWFGITWIQVAVAVLVAILGIVNSLTVTITDRRRELAVLQAVGGMRGQIRVAILMEAGAIALISIVLGFALGAIHLYYVLEICYRDFPGMKFDYMYPYSVALAVIPVLLGAALFSAAGPAESAVRGSLVEALEYE